MKIKLKYFIVLLASIGMVACSAEDGEDGLRGPQGPEGEQGVQGEPGTANVMYSGWIDVDWNVQNESDMKVMYMAEPEITEDFVASGTVLLYMLDEMGTYALPLTTNAIQYSYGFYPEGINMTFPDPGIVLIVRSLDSSALFSDINDTKVRYVLIPGGMPIASLNPADYRTIKEYCEMPITNFGHQPI